MIATKQKKPAKADNKRAKANSSLEPTTTPDQPEANGSSPQTALAPPHKRRLPVRYSDEIAETICERLRTGETLTSICKSESLPTESAVREWASEDTPFAAQYARARELGYQKMADDISDIDDEAGDPHRSRLRVDTRKWLLSKALPKIYGDRLEVDAKAGLVVVETPAAIKALLEALPELGVLPLNGSARAAITFNGEPGKPTPFDGEQS